MYVFNDFLKTIKTGFIGFCMIAPQLKMCIYWNMNTVLSELYFIHNICMLCKHGRLFTTTKVYYPPNFELYTHFLYQNAAVNVLQTYQQNKTVSYF